MIPLPTMSNPFLYQTGQKDADLTLISPERDDSRDGGFCLKKKKKLKKISLHHRVTTIGSTDYPQ